MLFLVTLEKTTNHIMFSLLIFFIIVVIIEAMSEYTNESWDFLFILHVTAYLGNKQNMLKENNI